MFASQLPSHLLGRPFPLTLLWHTHKHAPPTHRRPLQLGAMGLGTVLFQFSVGFFLALIIATTPRVAAHSDNPRLVRVAGAALAGGLGAVLSVCCAAILAKHAWHMWRMEKTRGRAVGGKREQLCEGASWLEKHALCCSPPCPTPPSHTLPQP